MNQDKIGIIGCGWLGLPLAKSLISNNYKVKGSTTRKNKLTVLKKEGIDPFLIEITDNSISESISSFLKGLDILIINIPPRIRIATMIKMIFTDFFIKSEYNYVGNYFAI